MPDDTSQVQDQAFASLVETTLSVLRTYTAPYHLMYPRLLAAGHNESEVAAEIAKTAYGIRSPVLVDYHIDRFYETVPNLRKRRDRAAIIAQAFERFDQEPKFEPAPTPPERAVDVLSDDQGKELSVDTPPTPPPERRPFKPPAGVQVPSDDELVDGINALPPSKYKLLALVTKHETCPSTEVMESIAGKLNILTLSANAVLSSVFADLHLKLPRGVDLEDWKQYRHKRVRTAFASVRNRDADAKPPPRPNPSPKDPLERAVPGRKPIGLPPEPRTVPYVEPEPQPEPKPKPPPTAEILSPVLSHRDSDAEARGEILLDVLHVPHLISEAQYVQELLASGYRIQYSYSIPQHESDLMTVLVFVRWGMPPGQH